MLLTEYRPFKVKKSLVEQSIKEKKPLIVSGIIQRAEAENQNKRVYPYKTLMNEIKNYIDGPIKERRALGELDHPDSSVINLQNVSHNITEIKVKGNDVYGTFEILDTPAGRMCRDRESIRAIVCSAAATVLPAGVLKTRIPFLLFCTVKGIPCEFVEITGFLNANDSKGTKGDNSQTEGRTRN